MRKQYQAVTAAEAVKHNAFFVGMKKQRKTIKAGQACLTALGLFLALSYWQLQSKAYLNPS